MEGQKYNFSRLVVSRYPDEYKNYARREVREEAGRKLLELLEQNKMPAVVDFDESTTRMGYSPYEENEVFELVLTVTPVQHHRVTYYTQDSITPKEFFVNKWTLFLRRLFNPNPDRNIWG